MLQAVADLVRRLNAQVPIFYKVLVANAALIAGTALASAWVIVREPVPDWAGAYTGSTVILAMAISASLLINYLLMRVAFHPLFLLRETMEDIRRGDREKRAPAISGDPDVAELAATLNQMLDQLARHQRSVASQILRALEDERKRFARELHDETSQALTNLVIRLDLVKDSLTGDVDSSQLAEEIGRIRDMAANALTETRRITFDMRPTILDDLGLVPALRWYVKHKLDPLGIQVEMDVTGFQGRLPDEVETALFRIVQEALTNVQKHARARNVKVTMRETEDLLTAEVLDDGVGFSMLELEGADAAGRGLGLFGMRERAELVGGRLTIESIRGRGTTVKVVIPRTVANL